jgi:xylose isomerase
MRTYLILKEKAERFNQDAEIQGIFNELNGGGDSRAAGGYSKDVAEALKSEFLDEGAEALASRSLPYEKLDQLVIELLLGVR